MSSFQEYGAERDLLHRLAEEGRTITGVSEDLDGALVSFSSSREGRGNAEAVTIRLGTADARKLVAGMVRLQRQR